MAIESGSPMTPASWTNLPTNESCRKAWTIRFDAYTLCFNRMHKMHDFLLISQKEKNRLAKSRCVNIREPYKGNVNQTAHISDKPEQDVSPQIIINTTGILNTRRAATIGITDPTRKADRERKKWWNLFILDPINGPKENPRGLPSNGRFYS